MTHFDFEQKFWNDDKIVAGADEVGRGAFAGPVVTAAVIFPVNSDIDIQNLEKKGIKINDSKKLTTDQRERASEWIKNNSLGWGIGIGDIKMINSAGIMPALHFAFRSAIYELQKSINTRVEYLLIDGFYVPRIRGIPRSNQTSIIRGDSTSASIAAASIVAKVYRDELMTKLGKVKNNQIYKWHKNKGYGTKEHREAIRLNGATNHHRIQYLKTSFLL